MRTVTRVFRLLGVVLGGLIGLLVLALAVIWWRPTTLLNERTAHWALRFAPEGTKVDWRRFRWDFSSEGWKGKKSELEIGGICFSRGEQVSGCIDKVYLDVSLSLLPPRLTRIGAFVLDVPELRLKTLPSENSPPPTSPLPDLRPPSFAALFPESIDLAKLGAIRVRVEQFTMQSPGAPDLWAKFSLERISSPQGVAFQVDGEAKRAGGLRASLGGEGSIEPGRLRWKGVAKGRFQGWQANVPLQLQWTDALKLESTPDLRRGNDHYRSPLGLAWTNEKLSMNLGRLEFHKLWPRKKILVESCRLESRLDRGQGYPSRSELECNLTLLSLQTGAILPPLQAKLNALVKLKPLDRERFRAEVDLREGGDSPYLASQMRLSAGANVDSHKWVFDREPELSFVADLKVPELQQWKKALERTPLALPAPFRTLHGPIELNVKSEKAEGAQLKFVAELGTELQGGGQKLITNSQANIVLRNPWRGARSIEVGARAELSDVALEAPPLKLEQPPQLLPDKRFSRQKRRPTEVASLPLAWKLQLTTGRPLRIKTNLLETAIPVALDLKFSHRTDMAGTVRIEPVPVALFKKKAQLRNLLLTFRDGSTVGEVDGLLEHRNPEVLIKVLLLGSTESPRVEFQSDPPLNRQQIVSVLLFNKSLTQLNEDESSSAGSFSQATADGALGLFSLFFLSSTPVESISYDPSTQTYSARMRLGDKTTVAVGSNFSRDRQVALRRRLGGRWAIRTELKDEQGRPDVLLTLLEWFKRF